VAGCVYVPTLRCFFLISLPAFVTSNTMEHEVLWIFTLLVLHSLKSTHHTTHHQDGLT
jgi:hypothetical protein